MVRREISYKKESGVAVLNINAVPRSGGELVLLAEAIAEACADILSEGGINAAVVTAEPGVFDMGAIPCLPRSADEAEESLRSLAVPLAGLDFPVIAALQGSVTGQGLELALACDIRIAAQGTSFSMPQVCAGIIPCDGGTQRLPRIVGRAKALEMILTGRQIGGEEAVGIGLVGRLVPPSELVTTAMDTARKMAVHAPFSLRYAKEAISRGLDMNISQGLRLEADLYFLLHTTEDRREGIEAFKEKRKPRFEGR